MKEAILRRLRSLRKNMVDFLDILVKTSLGTVRSGYYDIKFGMGNFFPKASLRESIINCVHAPIIAEVKPVSPSYGRLRQITDIAKVAVEMEDGGAAGISVLTEPKHFGGSLINLAEVKSHVRLPVLMKDIVVDPIQVEAAAKIGADAILLIYSVFERGYAKLSLEEFIDFAHSNGLEVLLEVYVRREFLSAIETDADLIGVNNRDLGTLRVDLNITRDILSSVNVDACDKIVVSESGIRSAEDIRVLQSYGARAFLVGSEIMLAEDIRKKVRELVMAL
jgi:indole-3-glycerol phosphate synthase